jgi:hypothetical protein
MVELSGLISALGLAPGNADADRIEASAKVQAVHPINKSRFMDVCSLESVIAVADNPSAHGPFRGWNP